MAQLPPNNMPLTQLDDTDTSCSDDYKPLSTTVISTTKKETTRQQIARLKRELKADRKKLVHAETIVKAQSSSYESYKNKMESSVDSLKATVADSNGKIECLTFMAETATAAAKTASQLVDDTSSTVISHNKDIIRNLQKKNDAQATKLAAAKDVAHSYQPTPERR